MAPEERDYFADRLDRAELEQLAAQAGGIAELVAVNSPSFRKLGRSIGDFSDDELTDLVLAEPRLLRRPLLVTDDGRVLTGGKAVDRV